MNLALLVNNEPVEALEQLKQAVVAMKRLRDPASPWLALALRSQSAAQHAVNDLRGAEGSTSEAEEIVRKRPQLAALFR